MLTAEQRETAADELRTAERTRVAVEPLVGRIDGIEVADAYPIQLINIGLRLDAGASVLGHKVGLSSAAMQQMMGVDEPDYGHLLSDMALSEGVPADAGRWLIPRVEPEVGFILGGDLPARTAPRTTCCARPRRYTCRLELIDSRIANWRIGSCPTRSRTTRRRPASCSARRG